MTWKNVYQITSIIAIALIPLISPALAAEPEFNLFVADDPDDGDTILSNGDTLTITFSEATNATSNAAITQAELIANFTDGGDSAPDWGTTFSGLWNADSTVLTVTISDITGATLTIGASTVEGRSTTNISSSAEGTNTELLDATSNPRSLTGDFGLFVASAPPKSGGGCSGDCEEPTLGVNSWGRQIVTDGFTYNNHSVDVEKFFTPYPLINTTVGNPNIAIFKVYDNSGPNAVKHFEFAFGMDHGQRIYESKANIVWDESWDGIQETYLVDPENALENVNVITTEGPCSDDDVPICRIFIIKHTFRAPLEFDIVGTQVWDAKRNSWQNYYNHGIHVEGDSLNPPKQYTGIDKGKTYHLIQTGKDTAIDQQGNTWSFDYEIWNKDYIKEEPIPSTSSVMTRQHTSFGELKLEQANDAKIVLLGFCPNCLDSYVDFKEPYAIEYSERIPKKYNLELLDKMEIQEQIAMQHLK